MATVIRGRRAAYDNIAAGEATGRERTHTDTVSPKQLYGGGRVTSTSTEVGDVGRSNVMAGSSVTDYGDTSIHENIVATGDGPGQGERLG